MIKIKVKSRKRVQPKFLSWRLIGAAVRGSSHEKLNLPCQDAFHSEQISNEIIIAAIADGAGSARLSDIGATIAVKVVVKELREFFKATDELGDFENIESAVFDSIAAAKVAVENGAQSRNQKVRDLASTLLLTIATPTFVIAAQIGDGGIVIKDKQENIIGLTSPESSEYINETCFLVSPNALEHTQFRIWHGQAKQLAMFSDGIQLLCMKMPEGIPYDRFFDPLFSYAEKTKDTNEGCATLSQFLSSTRMRNYTGDDVTLILATFGEN